MWALSAGAFWPTAEIVSGMCNLLGPGPSASRLNPFLSEDQQQAAAQLPQATFSQLGGMLSGLTEGRVKEIGPECFVD